MSAFVWQGHGSQTHRVICVHGTDSGKVISATPQRGTTDGPKTTDSATANNVAITVSGLSAGAVVPVDIFEDGNLIDSITIETLPADNQRFKIAWVSCLDMQVLSCLLRDIEADPLVKEVWFVGDNGYPDDPSSTLWGVTWTDIDSDRSFANYSSAVEVFFRNPYVQSLGRKKGIILITNDHDVRNGGSPDDVDWSTVVAAAKPVIASWYLGNPTNTDSGIDSGATYFRRTIGPIEAFFLETQFYKDGILSPADNGNATTPNKFLLGSTQQTWLKTRVAASTAAFKALVHGYRLGSIGDHSDGWKSYISSENNLHTAFANVKTTFHIEGDFHTSSITYKPDSAGTYRLGVNACPAGVYLKHSIGSTRLPGDLKWQQSDDGSDTNTVFTYGEIDINTGWQRIDLSVVGQRLNNSHRNVLWTGYLLPNDNSLHYSRRAIS